MQITLPAPLEASLTESRAAKVGSAQRPEGFRLDGRRAEDFREKLVQQAAPPNFQQRSERRRVADDEHGSAGAKCVELAKFAHELALRQPSRLRCLAERDFTRSVARWPDAARPAPA